MLKAHDISFKRIMTAGYISADTCHALLPKLYLKDLNPYEITSFQSFRRAELKRLFEDDNVAENLYYIEQLDKLIIQEPAKIYSLIEKYIYQADCYYKNFIENVGIKNYLENFVFGFKTYGDYSQYTGRVDSSTIMGMIKFTRYIEEILKRYILKQREEGFSGSVEKPSSDNYIINNETYVNDNADNDVIWEGFDQNESEKTSPLYIDDTYETLEIKLDEGEDDEVAVEDSTQQIAEEKPENTFPIPSFAGVEVKEIDKDAISGNNAEYYKYVYFLSSLSEEQLSPLYVFLDQKLKSTSIRAWNVIKVLGYKNYLVNYLFAEPNKILKARNFGRKSFTDLEEIRPSIVKCVEDLYNKEDNPLGDISFQYELDSEEKTLKEQLGPHLYTLVNKKLYKLLNEVGIRARNGIKHYGEYFIEDYVNKNSNIYNIKNIGKKSEKEVLYIINELKQYVATLKNQTLSDKDLFFLEKKAFYEGYVDEYVKNFYYENDHLPMLYMINLYFSKKIQSRQFFIFNSKNPIFEGEDCFSMEDIAKHLDLTRERVRQIYMKYRKCLCELINKSGDVILEGDLYILFHFFTDIKDWEYVIEQVKNRNYIDSTTQFDFALLEKQNFTPQFILFIINIVCSEYFANIGAPILPYPSSSYNEWNNCYLIRKDLTEKFDFQKFIELIREYEKTSTEDIVLTVREMVIDTFLSAWIDFDSNIIDDVSDIVSNLIIQELGIFPDENFCFTIEGKRKEDVADIIYDTLKLNGDPLSLDELFKIVQNTYPNRYKSSTSLKIIIQRDHRLCLVGTDNLVALLEWDHVKIGSIRNIIVGYLEMFDKPQKIKDIVSYVQKYRNTSDNSIRSTIGSGEQFVQFDEGYYGLKWKSYPNTYYLDKDKKKKGVNWFENCKEYYDFVQKKHRRPSRFISTEQDLYLWFQKATKDFANATLTQQQEISYLELCKSL